MSKKPSIPKGTRDFSPQEVAKRSYIINTIKKSFELYGFQPIETPSFENSETLMGKYGEEGDRLIFKILNSGDFLKNIKNELFDVNSSISYLLKEFFIHLKNSDIKFEPVEISNYVKNNFENFAITNGIGNTSLYRDYLIEYVNSKLNYILFLTFQRDELFTNQNSFDNFCETQLIELCTDASYFVISKNIKFITPQISEKALRYDLTVPFARYVVQYQNDITFPFKRYQIQPVWRADRPQKGRFREFYQCDADVVGSDSLWQEVELVQLYDEVFYKLGLNGTTIKINNRKILSGIAEVIGAEDKLIDFTVALDKLDKIGEDGVKKEMLEKGISSAALEKLQPLFSFKGSNEDKLASLLQMLTASETGKKGIGELRFVIENIEKLGLKSAQFELDVTLARGLNYYTGAIFEVAPPQNVQMGSIGGGGRYDDLTGIFGLKNVSGVGISFGLDRIYLVLDELNLFPETVLENTKVLFINFGEKESLYALKAIAQLRQNGIACELYPDTAKMGKQMTYADKRQIPYVVMAGESEIESGLFTLKNMKTGEQSQLNIQSLLKTV